MSAANVELDDCKTLSKTAKQIFQPRNMLKCQTILMKNTNLTSYCFYLFIYDLLGHGLLFRRDGLRLEITFANSRGGLLFETSLFSTLLLWASLRGFTVNNLRKRSRL